MKRIALIGAAGLLAYAAWRYSQDDDTGEVLDVGMYDGWPYWKPVPSVFTRSALGGGEWHCFAMLTDYEPANVGIEPPRSGRLE